jgi:hypothetical protein
MMKSKFPGGSLLMKKLALLGLIAMLAAFALPAAPSQAQSSTLTLVLKEQNGSGQNGTAVIFSKGNGVQVSLSLTNGTTEPQPAHIHKGTCANLDPKPALPLSSVVSGRSDTDVLITLADLEKGGYAINVHKSAAEVGTYVACGDILGLTTLPPYTGPIVGPGGTVSPYPGMPVTGNNDLPLLVGGLSLLALALTGAGLRLARRQA